MRHDREQGKGIQNSASVVGQLVVCVTLNLYLPLSLRHLMCDGVGLSGQIDCGDREKHTNDFVVFCPLFG